jgi:hypothetical protein
MTGNQPNRTWQANLVARYPALSNEVSHGRTSTPGYPTVGDRWRDLVEMAAARIARAVAAAPSDSFKFGQIKEKSAAVRIYWTVGSGLTDAMRCCVGEAIELAEARSTCTCETCGEPSRLCDKGDPNFVIEI